jgi:hypothetical protein
MQSLARNISTEASVATLAADVELAAFTPETLHAMLRARGVATLESHAKTRRVRKMEWGARIERPSPHCFAASRLRVTCLPASEEGSREGAEGEESHAKTRRREGETGISRSAKEDRWLCRSKHRQGYKLAVAWRLV